MPEVLAQMGGAFRDPGMAEPMPSPFITRAPGMIEQGNIDIYNRPQVTNPDGSVSTVHSVSFDEGGHAVLVPTVIKPTPNSPWQVVSPHEAWLHYRNTGQHLGKFDNYMSADAYSRGGLHQSQDQFYRSGRQPRYLESLQTRLKGSQ